MDAPIVGAEIAMAMVGELLDVASVLDHPAVDELAVSPGFFDGIAVDHDHSRLDTRDEARLGRAPRAGRGSDHRRP